jgi:hypothetical protein
MVLRLNTSPDHAQRTQRYSVLEAWLDDPGKTNKKKTIKK